MKQFLSQITTMVVGTVLVGIFAMNFKTADERAEIISRVTSITQPLAEIARQLAVS